MTVVATVGTTHPLAFAGLTFAMLALANDGIRPVCVVAGVTAQNATHLLASVAIDVATIRAQFDALRSADVRAFHVGSLVSADAVHAVADGVASYPNVPVVIDPVLATSGGDTLADASTRDALLDTLFARATLITPNLHEASALLGRSITTVDAMHVAANELLAVRPASRPPERRPPQRRAQPTFSQKAPARANSRRHASTSRYAERATFSR